MRKTTHQTDITKEVLKLVCNKVKAGEEVTDEMWNLCYDIVQANYQLDTLDWKLNILTVTL